MDKLLELIQQRVKAGNYNFKHHVALHALKEGFERKDIIAAILNGRIVEQYPVDERALICGQFPLIENFQIYLHVVCEYSDPNTSTSLRLIYLTKLNGKVLRINGDAPKIGYEAKICANLP